MSQVCVTSKRQQKRKRRSSAFLTYHLGRRHHQAGQASDAIDECVRRFPEIDKAYYNRPATGDPDDTIIRGLLADTPEEIEESYTYGEAKELIMDCEMEAANTPPAQDIFAPRSAKTERLGSGARVVTTTAQCATPLGQELLAVVIRPRVVAAPLGERLSGSEGKPDVWVARSSRVIFLAVQRWRPDRRRQVFADRIIQVHFTAVCHLLKQGGRENFGNGADLKNRVAIHLLDLAPFTHSIGDYIGSISVDHADNNAWRPILLVHALLKNCLNFGDRRCLGRQAVNRETETERQDSQCNCPRVYHILDCATVHA